MNYKNIIENNNLLYETFKRKYGDKLCCKNEDEKLCQIIKKMKNNMVNIASDIYKENSDAIVTVESYFSQINRKNNFSGFFIFYQDSYYIITTAHNVIAFSNENLEADKIIIGVSNVNETKKNKFFEAKILNYSGVIDVAILTIDNINEIFTKQKFLEFNTKNIDKGSNVFLIGNVVLNSDPPNSQMTSNQISQGILKENKFRNIQYNVSTSTLISANVYKGCGGAPIMSENGKIIGMLNYINFVITGQIAETLSYGPNSKILSFTIKKLINNNFNPGYLGISTINPDMITYNSLNKLNNNILGFEVVDVDINSNSNGVINVGDLILQIDDKNIGYFPNQYNISDITLYKNPNDIIKITLLRSNNIIYNFEIELVAYPSYANTPVFGFV